MRVPIELEAQVRDLGRRLERGEMPAQEPGALNEVAHLQRQVLDLEAELGAERARWEARELALAHALGLAANLGSRPTRNQVLTLLAAVKDARP
jgi:hypothetical protein